MAKLLGLGDITVKRYETIENNIKTVIVKETLNYLNEQEIEAKYVNFLEKILKMETHH